MILPSEPNIRTANSFRQARTLKDGLSSYQDGCHTRVSNGTSKARGITRWNQRSVSQKQKVKSGLTSDIWAYAYDVEGTIERHFEDFDHLLGVHLLSSDA
jgi:hypothetical protein